MIKTETLQFVQSARHVAVYMVLGWYHAVARCLFVLLARIFPLLIRHSLHCHLGLRSLSLPKCRGQLSSLNNRCRNKSGMTNPNHICHPGLRLVSLPKFRDLLIRYLSQIRHLLRCYPRLVRGAAYTAPIAFPHTPKPALRATSYPIPLTFLHLCILTPNH